MKSNDQHTRKMKSKKCKNIQSCIIEEQKKSIYNKKNISIITEKSCATYYTLNDGIVNV
jgi:hypothetical protein